jgi:DNA-binding NarL/FixJ family response regulator
MTSPRIIIADDSPLFRTGLEQALLKLIPAAGILHAESGMDVAELLTRQPVDLVFLDLQIPGVDGFELIRKIHVQHPQVKIIAVIAIEDHATVLEIFEAGAKGYLNRNSENCKLSKIIEIVFKDKIQATGTPSSNGKKSISSATMNSHPDKNPDHHPLSNREVEILGLICQQFSSKEIAELLHVNEKTIETHRNHLMWKTQSKNVVGLIVYAIEHGYFYPETRFRKQS